MSSIYVPWLTIFTPTYNRAHLLPRLYDSILCQANASIIWMIIDDGSTDNTTELIKKWQKESNFPIEYYYQENGGMHTAHNAAYQRIVTPLNLCIDSDDLLAPNALKNIQSVWKKIEHDQSIAGMVGLNVNFRTDEIVGNSFPDHFKKGNLLNLYENHNLKGDKKIALKTTFVRNCTPLYPVYEGEYLVPLSALYTSLNYQYDFSFYNEVWCIVDYQIDGASQNVWAQYQKSPQGFAYLRMMNIKYSPNVNFCVKNYLHLISCVIFAPKILKLIYSNRLLFGFIIFLPLGIGFHLYLRIKILLNRKAKNQLN